MFIRATRSTDEERLLARGVDLSTFPIQYPQAYVDATEILKS